VGNGIDFLSEHGALNTTFPENLITSLCKRS
jgi:hypothetical protein